MAFSSYLVFLTFDFAVHLSPIFGPEVVLTEGSWTFFEPPNCSALEALTACSLCPWQRRLSATFHGLHLHLLQAPWKLCDLHLYNTFLSFGLDNVSSKTFLLSRCVYGEL